MSKYDKCDGLSLRITLPMSVYHADTAELPPLERVAELLAKDTYSDGRYAFPVEMLLHGLQDVVRQALYDAISEQEQEKHGDEVVESEDGKSRIAKWHIEAVARIDDISVALEPIESASIVVSKQ